MISRWTQWHTDIANVATWLTRIALGATILLIAVYAVRFA